LSDGQKVLIALYLLLYCTAPHASLLCLDEPDNFVSIREIQPFLAELITISEDTGLQPLIISHTSEVIDYLGADHAILLERPDGASTRIGQLVSKSPLRLSELMARGWHVED
jgi:ABC-type glutathione transport system ATPase component